MRFIEKKRPAKREALKGDATVYGLAGALMGGREAPGLVLDCEIVLPRLATRRMVPRIHNAVPTIPRMRVML